MTFSPHEKFETHIELYVAKTKKTNIPHTSHVEQCQPDQAPVKHQ